MKIWLWFKSLSWVAILGAIGTAFWFVFNAMRASHLEDRAERSEKIAENIIQDHTKANFVKAAKLQKGVAKDKEKAAKLADKAKTQLEKLGEDKTMADIADSFNKRGVRKQPGGAA